MARKIDPSDIALPKGYEIDVFQKDLTTPICIDFNDKNEMLVGDAGITSGSGKVVKLSGNKKEVIAEGFNPPLTGITYHDGDIYVSHRRFVTVIKPNGKKIDILSGLPSLGDHHNNRVVVGPDHKLYFGQGTATNSGVVGEDNKGWVVDYPFFHDFPGSTVFLNGTNFQTDNFLTEAPHDKAYTGAFSPFGIFTHLGEFVKGIVRASGSILRCNKDGSNLELIAWGLRNPFRIKFDSYNRLLSTNHGMDIRGSRPIANSPDEFYYIWPNTWYGWPDFSGGEPITQPKFKPEGMSQPTFLLASHPMIPPRPITTFTPHSAIMGFDINHTSNFEGKGDVYIAEFGSEAPRTTGGKPLPDVGHRVSRIDMNTGRIIPFAINKSGFAASHTDGGGFERPIDALFGKDGALYIADFGTAGHGEHHGYEPNTGVIWKITRK